MKAVEDVYVWHWRNERYLRNEQSLARVAMVYSQQTAYVLRWRPARARVEDHALGLLPCAGQARIPFDMVHDQLLDAAHVGRYRTLILPNIAALSESSAGSLRTSCAAAAASSPRTRHRSTTNGASGEPTSVWRRCSAHRSPGRSMSDVSQLVPEHRQGSSAGTSIRWSADSKRRRRIINGVQWVHTRPAQAGHAPLHTVAVLS